MCLYLLLLLLKKLNYNKSQALSTIDYKLDPSTANPTGGHVWVGCWNEAEDLTITGYSNTKFYIQVDKENGASGKRKSLWNIYW